MMNKKILFSAIICIALFVSSCTTTNLSMKSPNNYVEFEKEDFELSEQVTGEAEATFIFMIDFERLFKKKQASVSAISIPIIGAYISMFDPNGKVKSYALYDMMEKNPGYDVVFYPQFEVVNSSPIGIPWIIQTSKVQTTARLAKLKK